jgi:hypothetical protein
MGPGTGPPPRVPEDGAAESFVRDAAEADVEGIVEPAFVDGGAQPQYTDVEEAGVLLALGCAVAVSLRLRGSRGLPEPARAGLRSEHVDHALVWVFAAGVSALLLAAWAALASPHHGGGGTTALVFVAIGAALIAASAWFSSVTPGLPTLRRSARVWRRRLRR